MALKIIATAFACYLMQAGLRTRGWQWQHNAYNISYQNAANHLTISAEKFL